LPEIGFGQGDQLLRLPIRSDDRKPYSRVIASCFAGKGNRLGQGGGKLAGFRIGLIPGQGDGQHGEACPAQPCCGHGARRIGQQCAQPGHDPFELRRRHVGPFALNPRQFQEDQGRSVLLLPVELLQPFDFTQKSPAVQQLRQPVAVAFLLQQGDAPFGGGKGLIGPAQLLLHLLQHGQGIRRHPVQGQAVQLRHIVQAAARVFLCFPLASILRPHGLRGIFRQGKVPQMKRRARIRRRGFARGDGAEGSQGFVIIRWCHVRMVACRLRPWDGNNSRPGVWVDRTQ